MIMVTEEEMNSWEDAAEWVDNSERIAKTLTAALRVVRAAEDLVEKANLACGYEIKPNDPPALIILDDLAKALKPFSSPGGKGA